MLQKNYVGHGSSQGGLYRHLDLPSWSLGGWYGAWRRASTERCVALLRVRRIGARARVVGLVPLKSDSEALEALSGENVLRLHGERVMVHAVPQKGARILPRGRGWLELLPLLWVVCPMRGEQEAPAPLGAWRGRIIHHQSPPPRCAWAQGAAPLAAGPRAAGRADIARRGRGARWRTPRVESCARPKLHALRAPPGEYRRSDAREARCVASRTALGGSE